MQVSLSFSLSWSREDLAQEGVTPSGIDGFCLQYNVTLSDIDGIFLRYQDEESNWQDWQEGEQGELKVDSHKTSLTLLGQDDHTYYFQINWGTPDSNWPNYNLDLWSPGPTVAKEGHSLAREPKGYDTNQPSDWIDLINPNPGD